MYTYSQRWFFRRRDISWHRQDSLGLSASTKWARAPSTHCHILAAIVGASSWDNSTAARPPLLPNATTLSQCDAAQKTYQRRKESLSILWTCLHRSQLVSTRYAVHHAHSFCLGSLVKTMSTTRLQCTLFHVSVRSSKTPLQATETSPHLPCTENFQLHAHLPLPAGAPAPKAEPSLHEEVGEQQKPRLLSAWHAAEGSHEHGLSSPTWLSSLPPDLPSPRFKTDKPMKCELDASTRDYGS